MICASWKLLANNYWVLRMFKLRKLRKILVKIGLLKQASHPFPNKGGWPGLRVLPKVDNLIDVGIGHQGSEGLYKFFLIHGSFLLIH